MIQDPNISAETMVAMTGLAPTRAPSEIELRGAIVTNYDARIKRRLATFLESTTVEPLKWARPPSQNSLWASLTKPLDPAEFTSWALEADLPVDVGIQWPMLIQQARDYVQSKWPLYRDNSLGLHTFELAADEYGDVWHLYRTLNDPDTMFDDLDSLLLLPEQVDAFRTIYPSLFQTTQRMAALLLEPYVEIQGLREAERWLSGEREEQLRILLQNPGDGPIQMVDEAPEQKPAEPSNTQRTNLVSDARVPSESIAEQRTANSR